MHGEEIGAHETQRSTSHPSHTSHMVDPRVEVFAIPLSLLARFNALKQPQVLNHQ